MRKIAILCFILHIGTDAFACEICGCGVGNFYMGITPQFNRHFIGVRYRRIAYQSHLAPDGKATYLTTNELFQTPEIWARFYPTQRWQVMAFLPYHFNQQTDYHQTFTKTLAGWGEATFLTNYRVVDNVADTFPHRLRHNLLIGGGIKLPTSRFKFDANDNRQVANPNFQLGSGSTDFLATLLYIIRAGKWGLSTDLNYKFNTANLDGYRFGNRLNGQITLFYARNFRGISVLPYAGVFGEFSYKDTHHGAELTNTGGRALFAVAGAELYVGRIAIGGNVQQPLLQNLANKAIQAHARGVLHLTFMI
ncbi:MAG: hypothetical protein RMJ44_02650 [Cytophagales bacterium]|nr:transporter [Bernardetiaceae bacterium]MDW8209962.1 hypothetical protein [Cytophagales bacterium]